MLKRVKKGGPVAPKEGLGGAKRGTVHFGLAATGVIPSAAHIPPRAEWGRIMRGATHGKTEAKRRKSSPGASKMRFPGAWGGHQGAKTPQERPRASQEPPREGPKGSQERPKSAQGAPKSGPGSPKGRSRAPRSAPRRPKSRQIRAKVAIWSENADLVKILVFTK